MMSHKKCGHLHEFGCTRTAKSQLQVIGKWRYSRRDGGENGGQGWTEAVGVNSRGESGSLPLVAAHSFLGQNTTWAKTNMKCLLPHRK